MSETKIELTFLGTGTSQGVPVIACGCDVCRSNDARDKRLRCSVALKIGDLQIVIDASMDFRYQALRENINRLDAILFTHEHRDHIGGLDDIRSYNYFQKEPTSIYCTTTVEGALRRMFDYIFDRADYPGVPKVMIHNFSNSPFMVGGVEVMPIRGSHSYFEVYGFRIGRLAYLTDFDAIDDEEVLKLSGVEVLVVNALRQDNHTSHFTLSQALELISKVNPKRAYLTHISHQMGLHSEVTKGLAEGVQLAYDGLKLEL